MKCEGCLIDSGYEPDPGCFAGLEEECHLTPVMFPLIKAMIAGEWKCESCDCGYPGREGEEYHCSLREPQYCWPCSLWQPKEDER